MKAINISLLRPSIISGLIKLRRELATHSDITPTNACRLLSATYANCGLDFDSALILHSATPDFNNDGAAAFRHVIETVLKTTSPPWLELLARGRDVLRATVDVDIQMCFERAGAFDSLPTPAVIEWLDRLSIQAFCSRNNYLLGNGRTAERLTYDFEVARLKVFSDAPEVKWISLDDNSAGFDILSYDYLDGTYAPLFIEVKSSQQRPAVIYITQNEWMTAKRMANSYVFYVWHLPSKSMQRYTPSEIEPHIPINCGKGKWDTMQMRLPE